jgi:hypothetical protein
MSDIKVFRSDNGPHFIADLTREFLAVVGVQHCLTSILKKKMLNG